MSHIYLYGFFSREDFARSGIGSAKDYDYGMKLIRAIFPDSEQAALWRDGRKYPRFVRTYEGSGENRMTDSYLLHALDTETDLPELLILLAALAASPRTLEQLRRSAELHCDDEESDCYSRVRRRVLELEQYGYLQKRGRTFALAHDWLRQLENEELEALVQFVRFAAGTAYPRDGRQLSAAQRGAGDAPAGDCRSRRSPCCCATMSAPASLMRTLSSNCRSSLPPDGAP